MDTIGALVSLALRCSLALLALGLAWSLLAPAAARLRHRYRTTRGMRRRAAEGAAAGRRILARCLPLARVPAWRALLRSLRALRERRRTPTVEVLASDPRRAGEVEGLLRRGLDRLASATGGRLPEDAAVLAQRTLEGGATGQTLRVPLPAGGERVLLRLALESGGRERTPDELLATLAEQYLGLRHTVPAPQGEAGASHQASPAEARPPQLLAVVAPPDPLLAPDSGDDISDPDADPLLRTA